MLLQDVHVRISIVIEVGNNEQIILSLPTLGMEALSIAIACVLGSCIAAWGLWKYINWKKEEKA